MRCVVRDVLQYVLVPNYGIGCSKKQKSYILKLKLERGGSNRSRESDDIVLTQAGASVGGNTAWLHPWTVIYSTRTSAVFSDGSSQCYSHCRPSSAVFVSTVFRQFYFLNLHNVVASINARP